MRQHLPLLCLTLACLASPAGADTVSRVADLAPGAPSGVPNLQAAVFDGHLYFAGRSDADLDLWVYNGIDPPTQVPGTSGTAPLSPVAWNGAVYFRGEAGADAEIWRYDGFNAAEVLDLDPAGSSEPEELTAFGDRLCFRATLPMLGQELVCWNGLGPAFDSFDLWPGSAGASPEGFLVAHDRLYFRATEPLTGNEPWTYDGSNPPEVIDDIWLGSSSLPSHFTAVGSDLYFMASDLGASDRLFRYDGVQPPAVVSPSFAVTGGLAEFRGRLYVVGHNDLPGTIDSLWRLDGSTLVLVGGSTALSLVDSFIPFAEALYFVSGPSIAGNEIFRFSGVGPPVAVTDFAGQPAEVVFRQLSTFGDRLFFVARDPTAGTELWSLASNHIMSDGFEHADLSAWSAVQP